MKEFMESQGYVKRWRSNYVYVYISAIKAHTKFSFQVDTLLFHKYKFGWGC